jgi:hypothetical protein
MVGILPLLHGVVMWVYKGGANIKKDHMKSPLSMGIEKKQMNHFLIEEYVM